MAESIGSATVQFTSYAQNFEDVMLWRALKHIERGFYIDIGAQDPLTDSVSMAFYEQGWRGVHIEPVAHYANRLKLARPDETVIQCAVGNVGVLTLFEVDGTGLSTGDPVIANEHRNAGFPVMEVEVACMTLANIVDRYADRDVHWLKIDVEGMEEQVLSHWKPSPSRPWIVVVESTSPLSRTDTHDEWEHLLFDLGYAAAYFDGLNRFYVANDHKDLKDAFYCGPNVFDGFVLSGTSSSPFCIALTSQISAHIQRAEEARRKLRALSLRLGTVTQHGETTRLELQQSIRQQQKEITALRATLVQTEVELHAYRREVNRLEDSAAEQERERRERKSLVTEALAQLRRSQREAESVARVLKQRELELATAKDESIAVAAALKQRELELATAKDESIAVAAALKQRELELATAKDEGGALATALADMYNSHSWRVTRPIRFLGFLVKRVGARKLRVMIRNGMRRTTTRLIDYIRARPLLKRATKYFVEHIPWMGQVARRMAVTSNTRSLVQDPTISVAGEPDLTLVPVSARRAYFDLLHARDAKRKEGDGR